MAVLKNKQKEDVRKMAQGHQLLRKSPLDIEPSVTDKPHERSFQYLASHILPAQMKRMREAMSNPCHMSDFKTSKKGYTAILRQFGLKQDFKGAYVMMEAGQPSYVGISSEVIRHLLQQVKSKDAFHGSLPYKIACRLFDCVHGVKSAMADPAFRIEFDNAREFVQTMDVAFIEIEDDLELHLFETYCAMEFGTWEWNSFKASP